MLKTLLLSAICNTYSFVVNRIFGLSRTQYQVRAESHVVQKKRLLIYLMFHGIDLYVRAVAEADG